MSNYSALSQQNKQGLQRRGTLGVKAESWLSLSPISHTHICKFMHTFAHMSLWLQLSCLYPQCVWVTMVTLFSLENGLDAVMRSWPKFIDLQDLVPVSEKKSRSALLRPRIDKKKSLETNLMNVFSGESQFMGCVYVLFLACCLFQQIIQAAFDYAFVYWVCSYMCMCVFHGYFLWLCLCSRDDSWLSVLLQREKIHTINLSLSNTLCHRQTHTHIQSGAVMLQFQLPHQETKMSVPSFMLFGATNTNEPKISSTCVHFVFPLTNSLWSCL